MRSSLKLLFFGVILPGALAPVVWGAVTDRDREVRIVRVGDPGVRVDVEGLVDVERIVEEATAAARAAEATARVAQATVENCAHARTVEAALDAGVTELRLRNGSGDVRVRGSEDEPVVRMEAVLCASSPELLEGLEARLSRTGSTARIDSEYPERSGWFGRDGYARIDLVVSVPEALDVQVEDGSGALSLRNVGAVELRDGSGRIEIVGAAGPVRVTDGSGEVDIRGVDGDLELIDGSGDVTLADVTGGVRVTDGSGPLVLRNIRGDVALTDGSGSIGVSGVGGRLVVAADGSGDLSYVGVEGEVVLPPKHRARR